MDNKKDLEILVELEVFDHLYELMRIVDPLSKKVLHYKNKNITEIDACCYDIWKKSRACENCISMRAYNENQSYVKIEYTQQKIYMVTATPAKLGSKKVVVELIKDMTNSLCFENEVNNSCADLRTVIENLNSYSYKDQLTGVYNRRYIFEKLPIDILNAILSQQSLSVIMADIDQFKCVNDNYGHLTGDFVLKTFADTLEQSLRRESDWVSRYGGEEFLICLPGADLGRAIAIAENMRKAVEDKEIIKDHQVIKITASFGVSSTKLTEGECCEALIERADQMLYAAKGKGRNRVEG